METPTFKLPTDKNGNTVSEDLLRRKYRLPSNTKIRRNLAIRFWYRSGMKVTEIMSQEICNDLKTPQAVYGILSSPAYRYMEMDYEMVPQKEDQADAS